MTSPRSPRDVLADVIGGWVESDADLYGYVDTLINALDRAGYNPNDVAGLYGEVDRLRQLLRDVVVDYGPRCCDAIGYCDCSMARASRAVGPITVHAPSSASPPQSGSGR